MVLDDYTSSIDEALVKAGLGWQVTHGDVLVVKTPEWIDNFGTEHPPELIPAKGFKANIRDDTGDVLGIVSDEYEVVDNRDAPGRLMVLVPTSAQTPATPRPCGRNVSRRRPAAGD